MNIILGGGIAGLIWAYYHKDHFILTDQVGGQMMSYFDLGPRYLHDKPEPVRNFLEELNVPIKFSTIKVGYLDDSGWIENPGPEFRQKYFMKSRGQDNLEGFDSTVLNTNIKEFQVCDVDFKDLINKLFEKIGDRIYMGRASSIDLENKIVKSDTNMVFKYSKLVSTIPLSIFARVAGLDIKLQSFDMAYCLLPSEVTFDLKDFDYVYDARQETVFHRLTKCKQGIVCDVFGSKVKEYMKQIWEKYYIVPKEEQIRLVKGNQIISLDKDFEILNRPEVKFVGRYGAWQRRWKTETVIEEAVADVC